MLKLLGCSLIFFSNVLLVHQKEYGEEVDIRDFPFLVSVMVKTEGDYLHNGGGTIVKLNIILTSCRVVGFVDRRDVTRPLDSKNIKVSAGTAMIYGSKDKNQQVREVMNNTLDTRCDLSKATYDMAILTLKDPFTVNEYVKPWRVYSWVEQDVKKAFGRLTEFQAECDQVLWSDFLPMDNQGPATGPWLTVGNVQIIPDARCRKYFCIFSNTLCDYRFAENGQFCAVAENGTVPCLEELGSALVCRGSVFGTVTFGSCSKCKPSVYINPVTIIAALKEYSPERFSAALTIWSAEILSIVGIMKYFLPALMAV